MTKTAEEFLEELRSKIHARVKYLNDMSLTSYGYGWLSESKSWLEEIEQFQAKQKKIQNPDIFDIQNLDEEEQELNDSLERGEWVSVKKQVSDEQNN